MITSRFFAFSSCLPACPHFSQPKQPEIPLSRAVRHNLLHSAPLGFLFSLLGSPLILHSDRPSILFSIQFRLSRFDLSIVFSSARLLQRAESCLFVSPRRAYDGLFDDCFFFAFRIPGLRLGRGHNRSLSLETLLIWWLFLRLDSFLSVLCDLVPRYLFHSTCVASDQKDKTEGDANDGVQAGSGMSSFLLL